MPKQWVPLLSRMFDSMDPRPWNDVKRDIEAGLDASPVGRAARAKAEAEASARNGEEGTESHRHDLLVRVVPFAGPLARWLRRRRASQKRIHLDDVFLRVNDRPLATASIAQVHCAQLDSAFRASLGWRWPASAGLGPSVVLKVQNQAMRGLMDSDVRNLGRLASFVGDMMPFDVGGVRAGFLTFFVFGLHFCGLFSFSRFVRSDVLRSNLERRRKRVPDLTAKILSKTIIINSSSGRCGRRSPKNSTLSARQGSNPRYEPAWEQPDSQTRSSSRGHCSLHVLAPYWLWRSSTACRCLRCSATAPEASRRGPRLEKVSLRSSELMVL